MNADTCGQRATMSASERALAASAGYRECSASKASILKVGSQVFE